MPVMSCEKDGKKGYKYGESGKCYVGEGAKKKAILQGVAMTQKTGEKLELSKEDLSDIEDRPVVKFEPMIKDNEQHLLFGWAYVAKDKDGKQLVDHSGEFIKEENFEDLENATYLFNIAYRDADIRHDCVAKGQLVESIVMTKEKQKAMGIPEGIVPLGVWMGYFFEKDEDWNEISKMESPMFSLYGSAIKEEVEE